MDALAFNSISCAIIKQRKEDREFREIIIIKNKGGE